jgi:ABC-type antimicrobial peptide transport system permease subunit
MGPLPVVISTSLQAATGAGIDSSFIALIAGQRVPVLVTDTIDYFPTMDPRGGGFMLFELESMLGHLNVLGSVYAVSPNEFFVRKDQTAGPEVGKTVSDLISFTGRVEDRDQRLEAVRLDPLTTAGWNLMALLALAVALFAGAFGYAAYLLVFSRRSRGEVGFLESMGLSRGQLKAMLAFEHLSIVAVGIGLGTWAGFRMSRLMITPLAVTEEGGEVIPPFILVTHWSMIAPTLVALVAIFLVALAVLDRSFARLDLQAIARVGEA